MAATSVTVPVAIAATLVGILIPSVLVALALRVPDRAVASWPGWLQWVGYHFGSVAIVAVATAAAAGVLIVGPVDAADLSPLLHLDTPAPWWSVVAAMYASVALLVLWRVAHARWGQRLLPRDEDRPGHAERGERRRDVAAEVVSGGGQGALEELAFRGVLQVAVTAILAPLVGLQPAAWIAVLAIAVLFGAVHFTTHDLVAQVSAAIIGVVLGATLLITGSLWAPLIAHAEWNAGMVLFSAMRRSKEQRAAAGTAEAVSG